MSEGPQLRNHNRLTPAELQSIAVYVEALEAGSASRSALAEAKNCAPVAARAELLVHLGLREHAERLAVLNFTHEVAFALADEHARVGAEELGYRSQKSGQTFFDRFVGRAVVLTGELRALLLVADTLAERSEPLEVVGVVLTGLPAMPGARELLHERYGAPVFAGLEDPRGGWLALEREPGGALTQVRGGERVVALGDEGQALPARECGVVALVEEEGAPLLTTCWGRVSAAAKGELAQIELSTPPLKLEGSPFELAELHARLVALKVSGYQLIFDEELRPHLWIQPGRVGEDARSELFEQIGELQGITVEIGEVGETRTGTWRRSRSLFRRQVSAIWAGEEGSASRRAAWREALFVAGFPGASPRVLDASSGQAIEGELAELGAELLRARRPLDYLAGSNTPGWEVRVGDPRAAEPGLARGGWITLLEGDARHEPMLLAGVDPADVALIRDLFERGAASEDLGSILFEGVYLQNYSRPVLVHGRAPELAGPLWLDEQRCVGSGDCARICPTGAITMGGEPSRPVIDADACIECQLCVERCETTALRQVASGASLMEPYVLVREAELVRKARLRQPPRALTGKYVEPPAKLDPRRAPATISTKPTVVLGLATVTLMEHTAALLVDGELVSAIEEERLVRERHYNWRHPERPGTSLSSDMCLSVEEAWPPRAIDAVLRTAGMTMEDVDIVALNGVPARFLNSFSGGWNWRPPPVLRANSLVFVPHHMSHAACVYGLSDLDEGWILSVDGRGDYETATVWRAEGHQLEVVDAVPWYPDCSFGGVYETFTRALGFGSHGQGSTMALAALGEPNVDVSSCMSLDDRGRPVLSERVAEALTRPYQRAYEDPIEQRHKDLAASIQLALETTVGDYLAQHAGDLRGKNLALCGGVALNCRMNGVLRERFAPAAMHVPPGANDAGTAIGAAMLGHRELTGELPRLGLGHTHFGPQWSDEAIAASLKRMRVPFQRLRDVGEQTAELLAQGRIVCWFQGPMEFGPRALGGRSILADPRRQDLKDRLNQMKSRQSWRPFGPSVLAGVQREWFVQDWDSRYMLFAIDVRPEKRDQIPVVVHFDGSTRPQMVHAEQQPRYHALISAFAERTGVPMVVNTSFNRGGEPIVCNPVEAMRSFMGLGADAIVLGDCLVRREMLRR